MLKSVKKSNAPQQIIQQIRNAILEGKLKPGARLASETELMETFAVSKATLREALRALEYLGLIEIRKGASGGVFLVEVDMEITKESLMNFLHFKNISIHHISDIRRSLESYAVRVAAEKISDEDLAELRNIVSICRDALQDSNMALLTENEVKFHRIIANATRNPLLILILDFVENLLEDLKKILRPNILFSQQVTESHERIYQALLSRDPEKAAEEMIKDITQVEKGLAMLSK